MLIGRSVRFSHALGMLAALAISPACGDASPPSHAGTEGTEGTASTASDGDDDDGTTGEPLPPLEGFADLHLHMFAEEAFGGGWLHGSAIGPGDVALAPCDGGEPGDHARLRDELAPLLGTCEGMTLEELAAKVPLVETIAVGGGGLITEFIGAIPGTSGDTGRHDDRVDGWPELEGWPRWDTIAHQQSWEEQLYAAYQGGLRIEVISAVSLSWLCRALPDANVARPECDEMADVRVQLERANEFANANDWVEIALDAAHARQIVSEGRLALVLSVEASHLLQDGDWRAGLDELHALGVRTLQPVHQLDNRFGGAAPHNTIFQVALYAENCHIDEDCGLTTNTLTLGFDVDAECKNTKGLSDDGKALVQEMMSRGMLVDAAHMSERSVRDLWDIAVANEYYPFYLSHGHFREVMTPPKRSEEKTTPAWVVQMLRDTGGIFGLRTAHEEVSSYGASPVANTCHGSSRSFAQAYDFGRLGLKVPIALGSDFNGFIQQTRPRFGPDACSASFEQEAQCQARDERNSGPAPLGADLDERGLAHVGTLPELLDDLDALGSDTTALRGSADAFVRMWERAEGERSGPVAAEGELDASGIVDAPPHAERLADYPVECSQPYCPGALQSGEACRFDAQCESGTCVDPGPCGNPRGTCE